MASLRPLSYFLLAGLVLCYADQTIIQRECIARVSNTTQHLLGAGVSSGFDQSPFSFARLVKRQSCDPGYGYCSRWNICCPEGSNARCCQDSATCVTGGQTCCSAAAGVDACDVGEQCCRGGCAPAGSTCCSGGTYCESPFTQCCEGGGCVPEGTQCCDGFSSDGRRKYCEAGNRCYAYDETPNDIFCCTDSSCTARVEGGTTITATSSARATSTARATTSVAVTRTIYYTFTHTWYYYRYYFTLYQQASVVTSTLRTTTTTFSVQATNSIDASSLAEGQIATITASPPADASTQLATYTSARAPVTVTDEPSPTGGVLNGNTDTQTVSVTDTVSLTATTSPTTGSQDIAGVAAPHMASSKWIVLGAALIKLAFM